MESGQIYMRLKTQILSFHQTMDYTLISWKNESFYDLVGFRDGQLHPMHDICHWWSILTYLNNGIDLESGLNLKLEGAEHTIYFSKMDNVTPESMVFSFICVYAYLVAKMCISLPIVWQ